MIDKIAILDELDAYYPVIRPLQPEDIRIQDVMAQFKCGRSSACRWLAKHVEEGRLIATDAINTESGHVVRVYRKVEA